MTVTHQNGHGRAFTIPARRYEGHDERTRRELFAKDREINRLQRRLAAASAALEYIAAVIDGKVGGQDPPWQVAQIAEAFTPELRKLADRRG
jgi:hypothetical protein